MFIFLKRISFFPSGWRSTFVNWVYNSWMQENWEVVNLDGRGRGLIARCDIAGGGKIMQEVALAAV
jgi:hypothetical protein